MRVCVRMCVRACVCACVRLCVCVFQAGALTDKHTGYYKVTTYTSVCVFVDNCVHTDTVLVFADTERKEV